MEGLSSSEAAAQRKKYGENTITARATFSPFKLFLSQFPNTINGVLFAAAIFSFVINNNLDAAFILAILLINGLFSFFQEYRAQKALEQLKDYATTTARVIRNGKTEEIPVEDVTIGDIVLLGEGDKIPADGILLSGFHIEVDESLLSGESVPVVKDIGNQLYKGTFVTKGKGHIKVEAIGMQTKFGQIAQSLSTIETTTTPLQKQISRLTKLLSLIGIAISLLLLPIGIMQGRDLFPLLLLTVSVAVAAIPESLPGVITIALAIGTNMLAKKQAIVRKMVSVETLGSVQVILTDKTGTLTQNNMVVKKDLLLKKTTLPHMLEACFRGNTATLTEDNHSIGDKTDGALLLWVKEKDGKYKELSQQAVIIDEYAFDSESKMITTIIERNKSTFAYMRGAPEELLKRSTLSQKEKGYVQKNVDAFAREGLRVIGFGYKKEQHAKPTRQHVESHITFLGILGLYDPPRILAKSAIESARAAGVRVIMVTGDNPLTALSIAKEVGLAKEDDEVLTGEQLHNINAEQLLQSILHVNVFARVLPEDKLFIATKLQEEGFVVGVTGDGVNDSLALEKADVGIAMGEKGSDVAKEAADIVLSNDDISVLVNAIHEGRHIYSSLVKAIMYLLAGNLAELLFVVTATLIDHPLPLLPTQILWINLVTDALPALALAGSSTNSPIGHHPRKANAFLLSGQNILFIVISAIILSGVTFAVFSLLLPVTTTGVARLVAFNTLIGTEMVLAFVLNKSLKNKLLLLTVGVTLLAQIAISTIPLFQKIFQLGN